MTDYKTLRNRCSCHGGKGKWTPYKPRHVIGALIPCRSGLHYCRDEQVVGWIDQEIWKFVDLAPKSTCPLADKMVTREGMITEKCKHWNKRSAALFAVDCARQALNRDACGLDNDYATALHACLDTVVGYIEGYCDTNSANAASKLSSEIHGEIYSTLGSYLADTADAVNIACTYRHSHTLEQVANTTSGAADMALPDRESLFVRAGYAGEEEAAARKAQYAILLRYLNGEEGPFVEEA